MAGIGLLQLSLKTEALWQRVCNRYAMSLAARQLLPLNLGSKARNSPPGMGCGFSTKGMRVNLYHVSHR
jgi:hypothetical protein